MPKIDSNGVRLRIHQRIRKHLSGTESRPRLTVFRSNKHIYAQIIDDSQGTTVTAASTLDADAKKDMKPINEVTKDILDIVDQKKKVLTPVTNGGK